MATKTTELCARLERATFGVVSWYKGLTLQESAGLFIYVNLFTFERCHRLCSGLVIESNTESYVAHYKVCEMI